MRDLDLEGEAPEQQFSIFSQHNLSPKLTLDFRGRFVDRLPAHGPDEYVAMDARVGWQVSESTTLELIGQNFFTGGHEEFHSFTIPEVPTIVDHSVYMRATVKF